MERIPEHGCATSPLNNFFWLHQPGGLEQFQLHTDPYYVIKVNVTVLHVLLTYHSELGAHFSLPFTQHC